MIHNVRCWQWRKHSAVLHSQGTDSHIRFTETHRHHTKIPTQLPIPKSQPKNSETPAEHPKRELRKLYATSSNRRAAFINITRYDNNLLQHPGEGSALRLKSPKRPFGNFGSKLQSYASRLKPRLCNPNFSTPKSQTQFRTSQNHRTLSDRSKVRFHASSSGLWHHPCDKNNSKRRPQSLYKGINKFKSTQQKPKPYLVFAIRFCKPQNRLLKLKSHTFTNPYIAFVYPPKHHPIIYKHKRTRTTGF